MKNIVFNIILYTFFCFSVIAADYPSIPKDIERKTFCDKGGKKFGHVLILLDITSPLDKPQINFVKDMVFSEEFYLNYEPFTKFSYLLIDRKKHQEQKFIFTKCRPKSGKTDPKREKASWTENNKILNKLFNEFVMQAKNQHTKVYANTGDAKNSFIYETIAYVFQNPKFDFGKKQKKRTLIIVSDMMQNSKRLSFYAACNANSEAAKCPSYKSFMQNLSDKDYMTATAPKGAGVKLHMIYLNNRYETNKEVDRSLIKLWKNYFLDRKFSPVKVTRQLDIN